MKINLSVVADIKNIIEQSRDNAIRAVDHQRTLMYWKIGKRIFEEEQSGTERAEYGKNLIRTLSEKLTPVFGSGFSEPQLDRARKFNRMFPIESSLSNQLSWAQYKLLIRIENQEQRKFYIAESIKNNWSVRQLERQISSSLYERLLMSKDKQSVLAVAQNEQSPTDPRDIIKDPMYLEFLGLKSDSSYYEKDLESAIISHLQEFMLELGNGFSFVSRQKRIHLDGDDFFIDLVFYNRLLQCFVIVEIKTHKITHQDLGQLQMYVNYYDRIEKQPNEKPTIGILLCTIKNDTVVKFSLPIDQNQLFASEYKLYLPSEKQLLDEINNEIKKFEKKG